MKGFKEKTFADRLQEAADARKAALERFKLYKLVWDLIGSEFAGRHMLYERFYAGNTIIVRNQSDREAPWQQFHATVDPLLERVSPPQASMS